MLGLLPTAGGSVEESAGCRRTFVVVGALGDGGVADVCRRLSALVKVGKHVRLVC